MIKLKKSSIALAIISSSSLLTYPTFSLAEQLTDASEVSNAENAVEVITVTGDFRQQNLQKTPISLTVLSEDDIKQRNAQNLEEIIALAPNVNFASGSQRARYYQIRGIGERSQFQEPINPSVGMIIDDIDFTGIGSIASTFDIAQTEIYRGPQGTRFGANAMAGLINITTNAPTDDFESSMRLTAGNYNSYGLGMVVSGPANDTIKYRVAVEQYQSDGYIENSYLNSDSTNNRDELTMRGKLAIEATDNLTIDVSLLHANFDNGYDTFSLDNNGITLSDQPGFDTQETTALSSKFTYTGLNSVDVVSIFSYADSNLGYGYDEDWAYEGISDPSVNPDIDPEFEYWEYTSIDHYFRDRSTFTGEVRFISQEDSEIFFGTTSWVTGVYIKQDNEDLLRQYTYLDDDYSSSFNTNTLAAFGQLDSKLSDKLLLTSGIRIEQRNADFTNSAQFSSEPTDTMVGGKAVLSYQMNHENMFYGSINRGYKAGGVNTGGTLPETLRAFDPEYLWNYELGYKVTFAENTAYFRATAFYMDRKDVQISTSIVEAREDGSSEFIPYIDNAATGYNKGVELDGAWHISDNVELYGALGLLDTLFDDYIDADGNLISGQEQAHAPNYQLNLGINYQPNEQWLVNVSVDGKDAFYFSDNNENHEERKSEPVQLLNASISYLQEHWQVRVWARNILDETYGTRGFYFGNDPRDGYSAKAYTQNGEPMVFGATLDYQF